MSQQRRTRTRIENHRTEKESCARRSPSQGAKGPQMKRRDDQFGFHHEISTRGAVVSPDIKAGVRRLEGGGAPLQKKELQFFQSRMGADFSKVRIHTDSNAIQTSSQEKAEKNGFKFDDILHNPYNHFHRTKGSVTWKLKTKYYDDLTLPSDFKRKYGMQGHC